MPNAFGRESVPIKLNGETVQVDQDDLHARVNELVDRLGVMHPISRYLVNGIPFDLNRHAFDSLLSDMDRSMKRYKRNMIEVKYPFTLIERARKALKSTERWDDF